MNHIPFTGVSWDFIMYTCLSEDPLCLADCPPDRYRFVSDDEGLVTLAINPADTCTRDFLMSNKFQEKLKKHARNVEIRVVADSNIPMPEPPPPPAPLPAPKKAEAAEKRTSTPLNSAFRRVIAASADFLRVLAEEESIHLSTINDVHEGTMKYLHRLKNVTANHD